MLNDRSANTLVYCFSIFSKSSKNNYGQNTALQLKKNSKIVHSDAFEFHSCFCLKINGPLISRPQKNLKDLLEKRILFIEQSKLLLTRKFLRVKFLVPFPTYEFSMKPDIEHFFQHLPSTWELPSLYCILFFQAVLRPNLAVLMLTGCFFKLIANFRNHDWTYRQF